MRRCLLIVVIAAAAAAGLARGQQQKSFLREGGRERESREFLLFGTSGLRGWSEPSASFCPIDGCNCRSIRVHAMPV